MTKKRLPLDPFDPKTPLSRDYQLGNLAWAILLLGLVCGAVLILSASFDRKSGWLQVAAGLVILFGGAGLARRLIRSI